MSALEEFDPESWQRDCVHRAWSHVVTLFLQFAIPICADLHLTKLLEKASMMGISTISRVRLDEWDFVVARFCMKWKKKRNIIVG